MRRRFGWRRVAEVPANGVLGMPGLKSVALARVGCEVTLVHRQPEVLARVARQWQARGLSVHNVLFSGDNVPLDDGTVDLAWSFCHLEHEADPLCYLSEMTRVSSRHLLIFTQNILSWGVWLHRLVHLRVGQPWDHGALSLMDAGAVRAVMARVCPRLKVVEVGGVDLPPWVDINMRAVDILPALALGRQPSSAPDREPPSTGHVPPDPGSWLPGPLLAWYRAVERRCPARLARLLAHHPYVLAEVVR